MMMFGVGKLLLWMSLLLLINKGTQSLIALIIILKFLFFLQSCKNCYFKFYTYVVTVFYHKDDFGICS